MEEKNNKFSDTIVDYINKGVNEGDGFEVIGFILALPDEQFDIISESFLFEFERQIKRDENKMLFSSMFSESEISSYNILTDKELDTYLESFFKELPNLSDKKKDFVKRLYTLSMNAISEVIDETCDQKIISIPIELCHPDAKIPTYANGTDAGLDIYALEDIEVLPGETKLIKTGLKVAIPIGYELQVRPKSGRALKTKLRVANSPGTIDSGYRDEIGVIIENIENPIQDIAYHFDENGKPIIDSILHGRSFFIEKGQKFAQLVLNEVPHVGFYTVKNIGEIEGNRGGGFGSTGLK